MNALFNRLQINEQMRQLCGEISTILGKVQMRMAADSSYVFSEDYRKLKEELRIRNSELRDLKDRRQRNQHVYTLVLCGDVSVAGKGRIKQTVNCDLDSIIDCKLGETTSLNLRDSSHKVMWNLIAARFGSFFVNSRFSLQYIVQLR